jgi:hypothetical protein
VVPVVWPAAIIVTMTGARRFPAPWTLDENNDACFIVRDKNGQAFGCFNETDVPKWDNAFSPSKGRA